MEHIYFPDGIYRLEYSEKQRCFHFENKEIKDVRKNGWYWLRVMSVQECTDFYVFMFNKYVRGRKTGRLPELDVVKLELELFIKLKSHRRKLANR